MEKHVANEGSLVIFALRGELDMLFRIVWLEMGKKDSLELHCKR